MEVNNSGAVRFPLAWWCLLATAAVVALISCGGARAASEAGNATIPLQCHGSECLISYRHPEVELMAVLDPEQVLASMLTTIKAGDIVRSTRNTNDPTKCDRGGPGVRYTPCVPTENPPTRVNPYPRKA